MKLQDLIGKTINSAYFMKHISTDDTGYIKLNFTDNTEIIIQGYCDSEWTDNSQGEYPTRINFYEIKNSRLQDDLIIDKDREE
jgi:hypothetical protein